MLRIAAGFSVSALLLAGLPNAALADACMCAPDANVMTPNGTPALVLLEQDDARREAPLPQDVLWCVDSDDPRCAPAGGQDSDPPRPAPTSSSTGALAGSDTADTDADDARRSTDAVGPRTGIRYRVERPPR